MKLEEFFNKQEKHWNDLTKDIPVLYDLDFNYDYDVDEDDDCCDTPLNIYAKTKSNDPNFALNNSLFLSTRLYDESATDVNSKIGEDIANRNDINLIVKVFNSNGDWVRISYRVIQGISRDDSKSQLLNPDSLILICDSPKVLNRLRNITPYTLRQTDGGCMSRSTANLDDIGERNEVSNYIKSVFDKVSDLKKKGGSYSYSYSLQQDSDGKTIVKYNLGDGKIVEKTFDGKCVDCHKTSDGDPKDGQEGKETPTSPISSALQRFKSLIDG